MKMIFEMLVALDGNDSLKRILVKDKTVDENGAAHGRGKERDDPRTADAGRNYLMTREDVDKWSKEVLATLVKPPVRFPPLISAISLIPFIPEEQGQG
jgi:hypothetical protein